MSVIDFFYLYLACLAVLDYAKEHTQEQILWKDKMLVKKGTNFVSAIDVF